MMGQKLNKLITYFIVLIMMLSNLTYHAIANEKRTVDLRKSTLDEVYLNGQSGADFSDGTSKQTAVRSLEKAVSLVKEGGIIYVVDTCEFTNSTVIDGKGATLTFDSSNSNMLMNIDSNIDVSITNLTFDGGNTPAYYYALIYIADGTLTLGQDTVITNFVNTSYGAAISIYSGATVNLNGTKVINNKSGSYSTAYAGGITVSGNLNIGEGTEITGNTMYDSTTAIDILVTSNGSVYLDGDVKIGTMAFSVNPTAPQVFISSALVNSIYIRKQTFFNASIVLPDLDFGNILATGENGYILTDQDIQKMTISNTSTYIVKQNDKKEAYIDKVPYEIKNEANMVGGKVVSNLTSAVYGQLVTFYPVADKGYKYIPNTLKVYEEGKPNYTVSFNQKDDKWTFNMLSKNLVLRAKFEAVPAVTPVISANLPNEKVLYDRGSLELKVEVEENESTVTYQWYKGNEPLQGETDSILTIPTTDYDDAGNYYVKVTSKGVAGDFVTVDSNICKVSIVIQPSDIVIEANIDSNKSLILGEDLKLEIKIKDVSEGTLTYQWYKDGKILVGATTNVYKIDNVDKNAEGNYSVKITNTNSLGQKKEVNSNKCVVKVAVKNIEVDSPKDLNGRVDNQETLWDAALSEDEKQGYKENGVDAFVYMKMTPMNNSNDEKYITQVLNDKKLGVQIDISVLKKIGNAEETHINELNEEIIITLDIPDSLRTQDQSRTYSIVRVHHNSDGTVRTDILEDLDTNIDTITFKTNLFSTYAIIYDEKANVNEAPKEDTPSKDIQTGVVDTSDKTLNEVILMTTLVGLSGLFLLLMKKRDIKNND